MSVKVTMGFKRRFLPFVWLGTKSHTIRLPRKRPIQPGDDIRAYADSRQKTMAIVGSWECTKVEDIVIERDGNIFLSDTILQADERDLFCWRDGFRAPTCLTEESLRRVGPHGSHALFMNYWTREAESDPKRVYPFRGNLIHWRFDEVSRSPLIHVPQIVALCPACKWFGGDVAMVHITANEFFADAFRPATKLMPACRACGTLLDNPPRIRVLQDILNAEVAAASRVPSSRRSNRKPSAVTSISDGLPCFPWGHK